MELLANILVLLLMAAFVAAVTKVFHHAIGSPSIKADGGIDFQTNTIFGRYGSWLVINQVKLMNKEVERQSQDFKEMTERGFEEIKDELKEKERVASGKENRAADYSDANLKRYYSPNPIEVTKINTKGRVSPWLPLGMCIVCFGTWFSVASFLIILPLLGFSMFWLPFVAAVSTMIAARI